MKLNNLARAIAIFLFVFIPFEMAHGQRRDRSIFQFQHTGWTVKEGAPGQIYSLAQTTDGYLWMATPSGLYRFDGIQFELYQPSSGQSLQSAYIQSLMATPDGGLWVGLNHGGADFLKDGRVTRYDASKGAPMGSILNFALDRDGGLWVATMDGLSRFVGSRWQSIGVDWGYSGQQVRALFIDREGTLWVASEDALFFLVRGSRKFQKCADHLGNTTSIGQTPDGTIWLSEDLRGGPGRDWKVSTIRRTPVLPAVIAQPLPRIEEIDAVGSLFVDHAGSLWIAGPDDLFRVPYPERLEKDKPYRLDEHTAERFQQKDGLTSDIAPVAGAIIEDLQGDIWIGTGTGLDRFRESNVVPMHMASSDTSQLLVAGDQGHVWSYTENFPQGSLVDLRGLTANSEPTQANPTAGYRDNNGVIWLGGAKGLWKFENGRLVSYPLPKAVIMRRRREEVQAITGDGAGGLWASIVGYGVWRWVNGVWSYFGKRRDLPDDTPVSLLADSAGRIWFGYMGSTIALLEHGHVKTFAAADGLRVENIQAIYERGGRVWFGGDRGLALFRDNRFQSFIPDGSAGFAGISGIVETPNGDLWLNATPGIFHIPAVEIERAIKEPSYRVRCNLFGILDGLTGKAVQLRPIPSEVESSDGRLWFSTNAGIFQIDPNHLLRNALAPTVYIRSFDSDGVVHSGPGVIRLPPRSTDVHIEYTAPNLSGPERTRYRFKLEGSDKGWQDAGTRREAFYTNLGPHHYRFRVIACNENGVWNNVGAVVDFTIAPAWFQTYWFFALCLGAAFLVLWSLYRMRVRQVAHAMSVRFDERLSERTRLARDLHDTLLQSVQASKYVADSSLRNSTYAGPMRDSMEELSVWLGHAIDEGRAAVNSLRASTMERNNLAAALQLSIEECRAHRSIAVSFSVAGEANEMHPIGREEIYRVGYEAIRNACAHSRATHLQVELTYGEDLILSVRDNGVGIDPATVGEGKRGHFGLQGMRERANRIRGKLIIVTSTTSGTEIRLVVPGNIIFYATPGHPKATFIRSLLKRIGLTSNSIDF